MKKNNKGFTLVELLAVIVIMGILMMVAIPSVTRTIENSRKDTFVDIAKSYGNAVRTLWTSDNLTCNGVVSSAVDDGDYYILINSKEGAKESLPVLVDQGGKSSWGNRDVNGYVRVNISTTPGVDDDGDGVFEKEPKRVTKFYVALSDGTHGLVDDDITKMDEVVRGNVVMSLSEEQLKKIELTVDDGRLDCAIDANGKYSCTAVNPIKNITGICVDDQTNVGVTGRVENLGTDFATDDWGAVVEALKNGNHSYQVGDTKDVDMGSFGVHKIRIANLSTPPECSQADFSQTACGVVLEFADIITTYNMNSDATSVGGWPATEMRTYLNSDIYNALPNVLQSAIINTKVVSGRSAFFEEDLIVTSTDKLYLLLPSEVYEYSLVSDVIKDPAAYLTRQFDYYQGAITQEEIMPKISKQYNGLNQDWWTRSAVGFGSAGYFYLIAEQLDNAMPLSSSIFGISPAFRIG